VVAFLNRPSEDHDRLAGLAVLTSSDIDVNSEDLSTVSCSTAPAELQRLAYFNCVCAVSVWDCDSDFFLQFLKTIVEACECELIDDI